MFTFLLSPSLRVQRKGFAPRLSASQHVLLSVQTSLHQLPRSAPCIHHFVQKATHSGSWNPFPRGTGTWPGWKKWKRSTEPATLAGTPQPLTLRYFASRVTELQDYRQRQKQPDAMLHCKYWKQFGFQIHSGFDVQLFLHLEISGFKMELMFETPLLENARLSLVAFPVYLRAVQQLFPILQMTSIKRLSVFFLFSLPFPLIK